MTVSSTSSRVVYAGNGSTTAFPFAFKISVAADMVVTYTDATGVDFVLSPGVFSATGFGLDAGGTVTYPLSGGPIASGTTLTIQRVISPTQPTSISNQGAMWPQVIEAALDRCIMIVQGFIDRANRGLRISATDGTALNELPNATARANSVLGFDGNGQPYAATLTGSLVGVATWLVDNFFGAATSAANACAALSAAYLPGNNAFTGTNTFPTQAATDNSTKAATTAFVANTLGGTVLRSYLSGLTLSTAGSSATFGIAAGVAADSTNVAMLALASAYTKTTSAWTVGTAAGSLDTGTIANTTWYHVWLIKRTDTGVVDVLTSLSATAPTMPANYTLKRRIGSMKTDGSAQWIKFIQDGDYFAWAVALLDVSVTHPGTSAVSRTLTVPTGVNVFAQINLSNTQGTTPFLHYVGDLAVDDAAPTASSAPLGSVYPGNGAQDGGNGSLLVRTNTSAQVRSRCSSNGVADVIYVATLGWIDRRGRDS